MREVGPAPLSPPLLKRLERELTPELLDRVRRFARTRVMAKRRAAVPGYDDPDDEAEILARDAVGLTILGHRPWDPERPLFTHLCRVVRSESSVDIRRASKFHLGSFDEIPMDDSVGDGDRLHVKATHEAPTALSRPRRNVTLTDAKRRLLDALRGLVHRDPAVTMLLDAYESGCTGRRDILDVTGMSPDTYRNARRKLDRMLAALPDNLNESAFDALEISHGF